MLAVGSAQGAVGAGVADLVERTAALDADRAGQTGETPWQGVATDDAVLSNRVVVVAAETGETHRRVQAASTSQQVESTGSAGGHVDVVPSRTAFAVPCEDVNGADLVASSDIVAVVGDLD